MENATIHLLSQESFYLLSKALVNHIGFTKAFALTALMERHELFEKRKLLEDKWFPYTREEMKQEWEVHFQLQRDIIKEFEKLGLLIFEKRGAVPQKNYYKLDFDKIDELMEIATKQYIKQRQETNRNNKQS
jgi:hypothetical protein